MTKGARSFSKVWFNVEHVDLVDEEDLFDSLVSVQHFNRRSIHTPGMISTLPSSRHFATLGVDLIPYLWLDFACVACEQN